MEAQGKTFLKKIGKTIAKDEPSASDKEVEKYYFRFIQELPKGDLKAALICHQTEYLSFFIRSFRKAVKKQETNAFQQSGKVLLEQEEVVTETNSFSLSCKDKSHLQVSSSDAAGMQEIVQLLKKGENVDELEKKTAELWKNSWFCKVQKEPSATEQTINKHCLMLMMTNGNADLHTLKNIMNMYFRYVQDDCEEIIRMKLKQRAKKQLETLQRFLQMCHLRRTLCGEDSLGFPSYADLVTALLSVYLDLFVTAYSGEEIDKCVQRQVHKFVKQLTAEMREKSLDTVLQMSAAASETSQCLSSLIRYLLRYKPAEQSHTHYLRYMLTVCIWRGILSDLQDIVMETRHIRAPKGFVQWVTEWQPLLQEEFPDDLKFKGRTVTRFLLDDINNDTLSLLTDVIANYERSLLDSLPDTGDEKQLSVSEVRKPSKRKKKNNKKTTVTEASADELGEGVEDHIFTLDRGSNKKAPTDAAEVENTATMQKQKRKHSSDSTEIFDCSHIDKMEVSSVSDGASTGSLFVIDRGGSGSSMAKKSKPSKNVGKKDKNAGRKRTSLSKKEPNDLMHISGLPAAIGKEEEKNAEFQMILKSDFLIKELKKGTESDFCEQEIEQSVFAESGGEASKIKAISAGWEEGNLELFSLDRSGAKRREDNGSVTPGYSGNRTLRDMSSFDQNIAKNSYKQSRNFSLISASNSEEEDHNTRQAALEDTVPGKESSKNRQRHSSNCKTKVVDGLRKSETEKQPESRTEEMDDATLLVTSTETIGINVGNDQCPPDNKISLAVRNQQITKSQTISPVLHRMRSSRRYTKSSGSLNSEIESEHPLDTEIHSNTNSREKVNLVSCPDAVTEAEKNRKGLSSPSEAGPFVKLKKFERSKIYKSSSDQASFSKQSENFSSFGKNSAKLIPNTGKKSTRDQSEAKSNIGWRKRMLRSHKLPSSSKYVSRQDCEVAGQTSQTEHSTLLVEGQEMQGSSPGHKMRQGHIIETRSKNLEKGHKLRSGKLIY